nr:MAG TPA: hypothetical protein [Caudoviricetes sp.]
MGAIKRNLKTAPKIYLISLYRYFPSTSRYSARCRYLSGYCRRL